MPHTVSTNITSVHDELNVRLYMADTGRISIISAPPRGRGINREHFLKDFRKYANQPPREAFPLLLSNCPFCKFQTAKVQHVDVEDFEFSDEDFSVGALEHCTNCLYWRWHHVENTVFASRGALCFYDYTSYLSKLREFDINLPEGCLAEIAQQLRRERGLWHSLEPSRFERLVADIFRANYVQSEVVHVGRPDDGGVDVLFVDSGKRNWLIQVKRREKASYAEGVNTVRNLLGAMILEKATYGIVVSTADHFTYRSRQAVGRADECGMTIRLLDRGVINRMLDPLLPDRPWLGTLTEHFPEYADYIVQKIPSSRQMNLFPDDNSV